MNINTIIDFLFSDRGRFVLVLLIILCTIMTVSLLKFLLNRYLKKRTSRVIKLDNTQYSFVNHFMSALIYLIGIGLAIYVIPSFRAFSVSIFAGAGVLAVILGFASQQAFSNIISGIFIVMFKPFRVGDWIKVKDVENVSGIVEDITLRHTMIKDFENKRIVIPNSVINNEIIENKNLEDNKICRFIEIGISYDSDVNRAIEIMRDEAKKHPLFIDARSDEEKQNNIDPVRVKVMGFGDSSVNLRAWVWSNTPINAFMMHLDLNKAIKERFDREGVEIPFPYRTLVYKKDLPKPKPLKKRRSKSASSKGKKKTQSKKPQKKAKSKKK